MINSFIANTRNYIEGHEDEIIQWLKEIVEIESPTDNRQAVNRVGQWIQDKVHALGGQIETIQSNHPNRGDHLIARWKGKDSQEKPLLIIAHMDTVWPIGTLKTMPFRIEEDKIYGPGTFDMKGAIVFLLFAIKMIREMGVPFTRTIHILFNSDEEMNSQTSREIIDKEALQAEAVLIPEGGVGEAIITERKGILYFKITVTGRASHAGMDHEEGINAIEEIAYQILQIQRLTNYDTGTTLNCGIVKGGTRTNVIPEKAELEVDARVVTMNEAERLIEKMKSLQPVLDGSKLHVYSLIKRPPLERTKEVKRLFEIAKRCCVMQGYELTESSTGAISDGNLTAARGIPTLDGLGPIGNGAHASHEHIVKSKMMKRILLITHLLLEI